MPGCRALSRLTDLDTKIDSFTIQCGNFANWNWRIYSHLIGQPFCKLGLGPSERAKQLLKLNQMYRSCCPELADAGKVDYLECDAFTQFTLVSIIWEELGNKHNFPTPYVMTSFICNEMGYLVLENNDSYSTLVKSQTPITTASAVVVDNNILSINNIKSTIMQIIIQLYLVQSHQLTLGNPSLDRLQVRAESVEYKVDSHSWTFPFTLFILPSALTSIQVKRPNANAIRLYPQSSGAKLGIDRLRLSTSFDVFTRSCDDSADFCVPKQIVTYRLTSDTIVTFEYLRYAGLPLFSNSIDLYLLFVALMCYKPFFDGINADVNTFKIWQTLWFPEDYAIIMQKVQKMHTVTQLILTLLSY